MRRLFPGVIDFLVTGFAGLRSHVFGWVGGTRADRGLARGLSAFSGGLRARLRRGADYGKKTDGKLKNSRDFGSS
jgi:hypothetical protein